MQNVLHKSEKKRILSLDGLRGVAILWIILYHLVPYLVPGGFLGVDIFLILSGYLMTNSMMKQLMTRSKMPLKAYLKRRFVHIAQPMMWMCLIVLIYITLFQRDLLINLRDSLLTSLTFTNNWWQILGGNSYFEQYLIQSPFVHLWYLSLNMQLYLLWPIVFVLLSYIFKKHRSITIAILMLAGLSFIWMFLLYIPNADPSRIYYGTDTRAFSLLLGAALAVEWPLVKFNDLLSTQQKRWMNWIGFVAIIGLVLAVSLLSDQTSLTYRFGIIAFDLLVVVLLRFGIHSQLLSSIVFRLKPLTWIGRRSFSYYLWYFPILILYQSFVELVQLNATIHIILQLLLVGAIGEMSYRFFETKGVTQWIIKQFDIVKVKALIPIMKQNPIGEWKLIARYIGLCSVAIVTLIGLFSMTSQPSEAMRQLESVIEANQKYAESTRSEDEHTNQVINNVEGLTREETVFSNTTEITFIGDSLLLAIADKLSPMYPNAIVDGATGRQLYQAKANVESLIAAGQMKQTVVVMLGANGNFTYAQLEEVIKAIGLDKQIFLVNVHLPRTWETNVNKTMEQATETYKNVHVIDWYTASQNHDDWFYEDRVHPNQIGSQQLALLITKQVYAVIRGN